MKKFTAIALAFILVFVASSYDVQVLDRSKIMGGGVQYHVVRTSTLTGSMQPLARLPVTLSCS